MLWEIVGGGGFDTDELIKLRANDGEGTRRFGFFLSFLGIYFPPGRGLKSPLDYGSYPNG